MAPTVICTKCLRAFCSYCLAVPGLDQTIMTKAWFPHANASALRTNLRLALLDQFVEQNERGLGEEGEDLSDSLQNALVEATVIRKDIEEGSEKE